MRSSIGAAPSGSSTRAETPPGTKLSPLIAVEKLSKDYGPLRAVDAVSFTVPRGEVAALLGPNGSGKTTVMRVLTGYFPPTAGQVSIAGFNLSEAPFEARRRVGYLPEQVSLYPELAVRRYLAFVAEVKRVRRAERRAAVEAVIGQCGLASVADRLTGRLSKGYRQRVGLAQALLGDPEVLVLDEPTVGLDPMQTVELRSVIRSLVGRTILLSTHILSEASALCERVIILDRGRVLAEDTALGLARRVERLCRLIVRVDGPGPEAARLLGALPGVVRVEPLADGFALLAPDPAPVQRALASLAVGAGWTLREMRTETPSLEDLFVRLVNRERGDG